MLNRIVTAPTERPSAIFWAVAGGWLVLDQAVKVLQRATMQTGDSIPLIEGVFHLTSHENTGAAFSMFSGHASTLALFAVLVLAVIYWLWRVERPRAIAAVVGLALLAAGAVGNAIDRVLFGSVTDIFDFRLINFAVFNVADTGITVGAIMVGAWVLYSGVALERGDTPNEH